MRLLFIVALLGLFAAVASAWEKEDHEIFDLVSALEAAEGKGTTFYSWLNVPYTANLDQLNKAYRKKSMQLHPDKNLGVKNIEERFARLGVVGTILRNPESRKRYDFFYKNGVPKWRGTGYYYARFRPGVGAVIAFLIIVTSAMHYLVQSLNYRRDTGRVSELVEAAKVAAWGPKLVPFDGRRKVKVPLGPPRTDTDGNAFARTIDVVVEGNGDVFLVEGSELIPLDNSATTPPSINRTWFVALCTSLFHRVTGKAPSASTEEADAAEESHEPTAAKASGRRKVTKRR